MSEKKDKGKKPEKAAPKEGKYLYVESIKEGPISAAATSGERIHLFKGLNKVKKDVWEACKKLPLIESYLKAETLKESKARCLDPVVEEKHSPEGVEKAALAREKMKSEDAKKKADDLKAKAKEADKSDKKDGDKKAKKDDKPAEQDGESKDEKSE